LAEEVISDVDMPPFNKAAMDGFACRKADLADELDITEEIPAGKKPMGIIGPRQCARIMTGAMIPEGADFILMKEHAEITPSGKVRRIKASANANICHQGEDVRTGDIVLTRGTRLLAAHLAMLASVGCTAPLVYRKPAICVISTGNELTDPGRVPEAGKIRDSNGYQLSAQVSQMGLSADYLGIVRDDGAELFKLMAEALVKYEVILISGGVSVGDYDYVPEVLGKLHVDILFHGMHVRPGKRLLFGKKGSCYVAGLPGNPVSSFVQFEVLVKPMINRLMGCTGRPLILLLPLEKAYSRKKKDTLLFVPVAFTEKGTVIPLEYHGSAHIHAYTVAMGIMEIPAGVGEIKAGEMVHVRPL